MFHSRSRLNPLRVTKKKVEINLDYDYVVFTEQEWVSQCQNP